MMETTALDRFGLSQGTFEVIVHPYRTKRVVPYFFKIDRQVMREIERELQEFAGANPDNHTVYELVPTDGSPTLYIWFHDFSAFIGTQMTDM